MTPAAAIALYILSRPSWLDRDTTREDRARVAERYASAIVGATDDPTEQAQLVTLAKYEGGFLTRIGAGECRPYECDHGTSRGWFQEKPAACPSAYRYAAGTEESIREEAVCAIRLLRFHGARCQRATDIPLVVGGFAGYSGAGCRWEGAIERAKTSVRIWGELRKMGARP